MQLVGHSAHTPPIRVGTILCSAGGGSLPWPSSGRVSQPFQLGERVVPPIGRSGPMMRCTGQVLGVPFANLRQRQTHNGGVCSRLTS
jgi:hypothetical protein